MKLSTLVEEVNKPGYIWLSRCPDTSEIFSYQIYQPGSMIQPGVVYLCNSEELPDPVPLKTSFFCVGYKADRGTPCGECNIVSFPGDLLSLAVNVGQVMTNEQKLQSNKQTLLAALNTGKGLQHLIDTAYTMLKNPIIVVDSAYKILAMNSNVIEDRPDLELQRQMGHLVDFNIESLKQDKIYEQARASNYPHYQVEPTYKVGWLNALIRVYGIEAAEIGVMEHDHEFTHYDYELTHFLSQLISLELQKDDFYKHNQALMHATLLSDLLSERMIDSKVIPRVRQLNWTLSDNMYILTIFDRNYGIFDHKAQVICEQMHQMYKKSHWVILENKIVFLLILSEEAESGDWAGLKDYLVINRLTAAVSNRFSDLFAVRWKYTQCEVAYTMGTQLNPGAELYFYKDYQLHHICSIVKNEIPLSAFAHPGVIAMNEYDRKNGTEFVPTLKEYLSEINNPGIAAKKLFIHKNTLFYRINKAKELFSLNLNDGYERLSIYLTIIFMEL